ncbi:MAG: CCA tRNA nucleotidyltransferase [Arenibacterium sp.]
MIKVEGAWRDTPETQTVCSILTKAGAQALFVGGCVRNALLGAPVNDVDIATDALPERVMDLANAGGLKALPTGIDHGTVTVVINGEAFEITTFRRDIETDGRHAKVVFSKHVSDDAARRDFTMNALYARPDGTLIDPLGGLPDLRARRLRFIGSAADRIQEDYLRSLRFFRFHAWYGDQSAGFDPEAIAAIASNLEGLEQLSKERIGSEMLKLLSAPDPAPSVAGLRSTNVLAHILPGMDDRFLAPLVHIEILLGLAPDPIRRLCALGGENLRDALRLSKANTRKLDQLRDAVGGIQAPAELGYRLGFETALDVLALRGAMTGQPPLTGDTEAVETGSNKTFPVRAADLTPTYQGAELGKRLTRLEQDWIDSGFTLTKSELLSRDG